MGIGGYLKRARANAKLKQSDVIRMLDDRHARELVDYSGFTKGKLHYITQGTLSKWESDEHKEEPNISQMKELAEIYKCDFRYLIGEIDEPHEVEHTLVELTGLSANACSALERIKGHKGQSKFDIALRIVDRLLSASISDVSPYDIDPVPDFIRNKSKQNRYPLVPETILLSIASSIANYKQVFFSHLTNPNRTPDALEGKVYRMHKRLSDFGDYILQQEMKEMVEGKLNNVKEREAQNEK